MKYTLIIFTLFLACNLSLAQTAPLEGKENAVELNKEIEGKKKVTVRPSTLSGTSELKPLYIIEGKAVESNVLDDMNPNTIKSIEVLKGKAATDLYGEKGANGVIVIALKEKHANKFKKKYQKKHQKK